MSTPRKTTNILISGAQITLQKQEYKQLPPENSILIVIITEKSNSAETQDRDFKTANIIFKKFKEDETEDHKDMNN